MKEYVVRLTGSSQKARRARVLLQIDAEGADWSDRRVADALLCGDKTVENMRQRSVLEGFHLSLCRKQRSCPPVSKLLEAEQAQLIALRPGPPLPGCGNRSRRLLARRVGVLVSEYPDASSDRRPGWLVVAARLSQTTSTCTIPSASLTGRPTADCNPLGRPLDRPSLVAAQTASRRAQLP